jgi:hypothetical protein
MKLSSEFSLIRHATKNADGQPEEPFCGRQMGFLKCSTEQGSAEDTDIWTYLRSAELPANARIPIVQPLSTLYLSLA